MAVRPCQVPPRAPTRSMSSWDGRRAVSGMAFLLLACPCPSPSFSRPSDRGLSVLRAACADRGSANSHRGARPVCGWDFRSEEHTSELQSLMRISYDVFFLKKKTKRISTITPPPTPPPLNHIPNPQHQNFFTKPKYHVYTHTYTHTDTRPTADHTTTKLSAYQHQLLQ